MVDTLIGAKYSGFVKIAKMIITTIKEFNDMEDTGGHLWTKGYVSHLAQQKQ